MKLFVITFSVAVDYCTFYGKKVDPEPGRCRRTDGKKWRCSKDAYPGSKYCERHMHRGRNRSRKAVESQTMTQSSSTVTSLTVTGSSSGTGSFQNLPLRTYGNPQGTGSGPNQSHYHMNCIPRGIPTKDCRYHRLFIYWLCAYSKWVAKLIPSYMVFKKGKRI